MAGGNKQSFKVPCHGSHGQVLPWQQKECLTEVGWMG
jgi:hypothetical protein